MRCYCIWSVICYSVPAIHRVTVIDCHMMRYQPCNNNNLYYRGRLKRIIIIYYKRLKTSKQCACKGKAFGLLLNDKKCEFISRTAVSAYPAFRNFVDLSTEEAELLGAPLTVGTAMDTALSSRCDDLTRAATRLSSIASHDALVLLNASFSAPPLQWTRCTR